MRLFSFCGYGLALAALVLVVFGAYDSYPHFFPGKQHFFVSVLVEISVPSPFFFYFLEFSEDSSTTNNVHCEAGSAL